MPAWKGIVGKGFHPDDFRQYLGTLTFTDWRPQFVVVHNTAAPRLSQWHSTPGDQRMQNLQTYYRDQMKWSAGPHLFVADDLIWVFTPLTTSGVHSPSWNSVSWGVEIVGDYDSETFAGAIQANAVDALAMLHQWRGIDPQTLHFHKEDPLTTHKDCPGNSVVKPALIAAIQSRLAAMSQGEHPVGQVSAAPAASAAPPAAAPADGAAGAQQQVSQQQVSYGWKPDLPDHRDLLYGTTQLGLEAPATMPAKADVRANCPAVYDQGRLDSCTANAIAAAFKFIENKSGQGKLDPSRLFIYYNERALENSVDSDSGAQLRDGIKCVATNGICSETAWPYDVLAFAQEPPQPCFDQALTYKALSYFRLDNTKLVELKTCLAAGFPFVAGFSIYPSFRDGDTNGGLVPIPGNESLVGGHAVLVVGYDDATQRFTVQNSWGPDLGDHGYYYMPYGYLTTVLTNDCWTVRSIGAASSPDAATSAAAPSAAPSAAPPPAPKPAVGLARDMDTAKQYLAAIKDAATKYNVSPSLICALGSRESGWGLGSGMRPPGPAGTGDWAPRNPSRFGYAMPPDGLGWGRGLLQIDYQQDFGKTGNWQDPAANILYGIAELAANVAYFAKTPRAGVDSQRAGIAAYNCGRGNVTNAINRGFDVDRYTANSNYSQDVVSRMQWFQQEGFDQLTPAPLAGAAAAGPPTVTVHTGKRYQATVTLSWIEQEVATNALIAGQFARLGFSDVAVTGSGATRVATGHWTGADTTVPLDSHLSNVVELA